MEWSGTNENASTVQYGEGLKWILQKHGVPSDESIQATVRLQKEALNLPPDHAFDPAKGFDFSFAVAANKALDDAGWTVK